MLSVFVTLKSFMILTSVLRVQNPQTSRSLLWNCFSLGVVGLALFVAILRLELMSGLSFLVNWLLLSANLVTNARSGVPPVCSGFCCGVVECQDSLSSCRRDCVGQKNKQVAHISLEYRVG